MCCDWRSPPGGALGKCERIGLWWRANPPDPLKAPVLGHVIFDDSSNMKMTLIDTAPFIGPDEVLHAAGKSIGTPDEK